MKKYLLGFLSLLLLFTGCNKEEKVTSSMDKLERITRYKNGSSVADVLLRIIYNSEGNIDQIEEYGGSDLALYSYIFRSTLVSVTYMSSNSVQADYRTLDLSSGRVYSEKFKAMNDRDGSSESYIKDEFKYSYQSGRLSSVKWISTLPDGDGYDRVEVADAVKFSYQNNNLSELKWSVDIYNRTKMEFTYSDTSVPSNFPLRFLRPVDPDKWEILDPLNFYYGTGNLKLPSSIKVYNIASNWVTEEYSFTYKLLNGYVTGMFMNCLKNGETTQYEYAFTYK